MDRRDCLRLLLIAPAALWLKKSKPAPLAAAETNDLLTCGICGSHSVCFDRGLDIHSCCKCGAHETAKGWQQR